MKRYVIIPIVVPCLVGVNILIWEHVAVYKRRGWLTGQHEQCLIVWIFFEKCTYCKVVGGQVSEFSQGFVGV